MAFCLPFSTALTLIFSTFGVLFGIAGLSWEATKKVMSHPISLLCVALFLWLAVTMLWSIAPREEMIEGILKYRKLLLAPFVAILLLAAGARPRFLMTFFATGCIIVTLGSMSSWTGMTEYLLGPQSHPGQGWIITGVDGKNLFYLGPPEKPTFGRSHIAQGAFLAISSLYLISYILRHDMTTACAKKNLLVCSLILLQFLTLLNIGGMTGYVLISIGLVLWLLNEAWAGNNKRISIFVSAILLLASATYLFSKPANQRINKSIADTQSFIEVGAQTSEGQRLTFWLSGLKNSSDRPLLGFGVGSFAEVFSRDGAMPRELRESRAQPHSEYILMLVQGGIVALTLFILILLQSLKIYRNNFHRRRTKLVSAQGSWEAGTIAILMIVYFVDASFNSVLWDLAEGHTFIILTATLLTSTLELDKPSKKTIL